MKNLSTKKRLLWVDDDGKDHFVYEIYCLEEKGWAVDWATSGEEASQKLCAGLYNVLLLDQVFPWRTGAKNEWAGCRLLYWLRSGDKPEEAQGEKSWEPLYTKEPLLENRSIPVIILSAFYDEDVVQAIKRIDESVPIEEKPIDEERLVEDVEGFSQGVVS